MKRTFDIVAAALGVVILSPLLLMAAVLVKLSSPGPVFFQQERIGKGFRPFLIYKFRTMRPDAPATGMLITVGNDPRVTCIGRLLRKTKIDELPQLINVLKGDMSLVGPRPEVPKYVELFRADYDEILRVRPGITDLASLKYRDEAAVLGDSSNVEERYETQILPDKIKLGKEYIKRSSFLFDLKLIEKTLRTLFGS
jgi:lipopolysaccharide/colanic/teichoic acid biosynthesis glycosyltransferase